MESAHEVDLYFGFYLAVDKLKTDKVKIIFI